MYKRRKKRNEKSSIFQMTATLTTDPNMKPIQQIIRENMFGSVAKVAVMCNIEVFFAEYMTLSYILCSTLSSLFLFCFFFHVTIKLYIFGILRVLRVQINYNPSEIL